MAQQHRLYVKTAVAAAETTQALLRYVHLHLGELRRMGADLSVHRVSDRALADPAVVRAFASGGITGLPALSVGARVYVGLREIVGFYDRNLRAFAEAGGGPAEEEEEDPLRAFYSREVGRGGDEEDEVGEGGGRMLDDVHRHVEARKARAPAPAGRAPPPPAARAPPAPAARARPDNVAPPGRAPPPPADDDDFQATLDRLAGDIDGGLRDAAFAAAVPYDEEGGGDNPADRLMERAYYANRVDSLGGPGSP